jgi:hypothetical protein
MFEELIRLGPPSESLLRTFIWCTKDPEGLAGVADVMQPFAEQARRDPTWRFYQLNSPPDAFIHMPQAVADLFDEVARSG